MMTKVRPQIISLEREWSTVVWTAIEVREVLVFHVQIVLRSTYICTVNTMRLRETLHLDVLPGGTTGILNIFWHSAELPTIRTNLRKADLFFQSSRRNSEADRWISLKSVAIGTDITNDRTWTYDVSYTVWYCSFNQQRYTGHLVFLKHEICCNTFCSNETWSAETETDWPVRNRS